MAFETLFDPKGEVAAYSLLGANQSGFGHVEVHNPIAGTWTAVIFTVSNAPYFGPVQFSYITQQFHPAGSVSPSSRTLAPGQTGTFKVTRHPQPGGGQGRSSCTWAPAAAPTGASRSSSALWSRSARRRDVHRHAHRRRGHLQRGQEFTYQFNVPSGKPSLNLGDPAGDPNYGLEGFLIDPNGQPLDAQTTANDRPRPRADHAVLPSLTGARPVDPGPARGAARSTART